MKTSSDLSMYLLNDTGVVTVAGDSFGAPGYIRLSYATSDETINKIDSDLNNISISTKNNIFKKSKLLIAADGKNSFIRNFYNLPSYKIRYDQSALVVNFQHSKNHKNTAFEIFLPNGPLATLPMKSNKKNIYKSSMIWSEKTSIVRDLNQLNSNYLKDIIEEKIYQHIEDCETWEDVLKTILTELKPFQKHLNNFHIHPDGAENMSKIYLQIVKL